MTTKQKKYRPFVVSIDSTTRYDTLTLQEWHKFRDEECERFRKEKEEEE